MPDVSLVTNYRPLQLADDLPESYASQNIEDWSAMQSLFIKYRFKPEEESSTYVNLLLANRSRYAQEGRKIIANAFDKVSVFSDWGDAIAKAKTVPEHLRRLLPQRFFLVVPYLVYTVRGYSTYVPAGMNEHADIMPWYTRPGRLDWRTLRPLETFSFGKLEGVYAHNAGRTRVTLFNAWSTKLYMQPSRDDRKMLMEADLDEALGGVLI